MREHKDKRPTIISSPKFEFIPDSENYNSLLEQKYSYPKEDTIVMTEFQSKPVSISQPSTSIISEKYGHHATTSDSIGGSCSTPTETYSLPIFQYLLRFLTVISESYTGWREFEDDLIIYSKSTGTKQLVSSFILLLFLILTIWVYKKLKIF